MCNEKYFSVKLNFMHDHKNKFIDDCLNEKLSSGRDSNFMGHV